MGGALDRLQMDENDIEDEDTNVPVRPSAKALGKRRVVEEVDDGALTFSSDDKFSFVFADASCD